ncbi:MAG: hypothetical protein AB7V50_07830 [Vampirovibrionia bacterium]
MNIQNFARTNYSVQPQKVSQPVAFQATIPELKDALEKADHPDLCDGKKGFIKVKLIKFFEAAQAFLADKAKKDDTVPKKFAFKLAERNEIPEALKDFRSEGLQGMTIKQKEDFLIENEFKCSPTSTCDCGKGIPLGEYFAKTVLAEYVGVKNPEVIELDVDNVK